MKKLLLLVPLIFLLACGGKLNKENYDKVQNGMSMSEVETILGKGDSQASSNVDLGQFGGMLSTEVKTWQSGLKVISITFSN